MKKKHQLTCIDLFAGCGGLSRGLEDAGFSPVAFCELNKDAAASYLANRPSADIAAFRDVREMSNEVLQKLLSTWRRTGIAEIDLVCGGPPCQGYSGIGHRRSYSVEREAIPSNHLYKEMIRVIRAIKPRAFLFENVKGLLTGRWTKDGQQGEIWRDVLAAFAGIEGYEVRSALVQAKDYGVPQNRPRVLVVGIRRDLPWVPSKSLVADGLLPQPAGTPPHLSELLDDLIDPQYPSVSQTKAYPKAASSDVQRSLRTRPDGTIAKKGDSVTEHEYSKHSADVRAKFTAMLRSGGTIPDKYKTKKFAQRLLRPHWDAAGPNITATSLPDDFVHYKQPRTLTVREWARIQTFPDWYQFRGPRTTGGTRRAGVPTNGVWDRDVPRYTQIGNAVPVWLARAVGSHLRSLLLQNPSGHRKA
jgi:DNA (cytosine-5)-methyltransferase 1